MLEHLCQRQNQTQGQGQGAGGDASHIVRLMDYFIFRRHLCLVTELLSVNLYELVKQNMFRGLSTNLIRVFMVQILDALTTLAQVCFVVPGCFIYLFIFILGLLMLMPVSHVHI